MRRTILVVDDNALNARLFRDLLRAQGYAVLQAGDGAHGLALARAHRPDLIILDLELPVMHGLEAAGCARRDRTLRSIPILAVSAFPLGALRDTLNEVGCDAYLEKPIRAAPFLAAVGRLLD